MNEALFMEFQTKFMKIDSWIIYFPILKLKIGMIFGVGLREKLTDRH